MQRPNAARVVDAFGKVEKQLKPGGLWLGASVGDWLPVAATVRTGEDAALLLALPDGHRVRVGAKSTVVLQQLGKDKEFALKVIAGQIWSLVKKASQPSRFSVETPSAVAGVTGTFFCVALDDVSGETTVSTGEGSVRVSDSGRSGEAVPVRAGFMTRVPRFREGVALRRLGALAHDDGQKQMWRALAREGAWAQQNGRGPMRLRRGMEGQLHGFLWRHRPGAPSAPGRRRPPGR